MATRMTQDGGRVKSFMFFHAAESLRTNLMPKLQNSLSNVLSDAISLSFVLGVKKSRSTCVRFKNVINDRHKYVRILVLKN